MAAVASDDGREVAVALDELRQQGRLGRNPADGRYFLTAPTQPARLLNHARAQSERF